MNNEQMSTEVLINLCYLLISTRKLPSKTQQLDNICLCIQSPVVIHIDPERILLFLYRFIPLGLCLNAENGKNDLCKLQV